ncbi:MAG: hypothetical protein KC503_19080 [Myxococcales bacterium]|nr:hypothetical protein [Myxococcales bacterium]
MLTRDEMLATYAPSAADYRLMVGFEYEVHCFDRATMKPLGYERMRAMLERATRFAGGQIVDDELIHRAELPGGALLSLEPGGQFEFSSPPVDRFGLFLEQSQRFRELVEAAVSGDDVHVFYGGLTPVHTVDEIGLVVPKERYRMMDAYFPHVGTMGRRMMRQSASVQVTFDYRNPALGQELLQTALYLSPFAAALFCNCPFVDGNNTGYRSYRVPIWADTDSARSGLLPGFTRDDYSFDDYLDHVIAAPMFFVQTQSGYRDVGRISFDKFNREGIDGRQTTIDDFKLHNSTIFTDVRLKNTVEVRSIDGQDPELVPSVVAFLCGLLLCSTARQRAREVLRAMHIDYSALPDKLAREGLTGMVEGEPVAEIVYELVDLAGEGLTKCFADGAEGRKFLEPLRWFAEQRKTPADVVLERFGDAKTWLAAGRTFGDGTPW